MFLSLRSWKSVHQRKVTGLNHLNEGEAICNRIACSLIRHISNNRCLLPVLRFLPPPLRRQHVCLRKARIKGKGHLKVNVLIANAVKAISFKKEPHITKVKILLKVNLTKDHLKETVPPLAEVPQILVWYVISVICMVTYHRIVVNDRHCTTLRLANKLGVDLIHDSNYL